MNTLDILIIAGVVVLLIAAWLRTRKKGGSCSGCSGCCSECSMKCNRKDKNQ